MNERERGNYESCIIKKGFFLALSLSHSAEIRFLFVQRSGVRGTGIRIIAVIFKVHNSSVFINKWARDGERVRERMAER